MTQVASTPPSRQFFSQLPQCSASVLVFTQAPSQSVLFPQLATQVVPTQLTVPPVGGVHCLPQEPQLLLSDRMQLFPHFKYPDRQLKSQAPSRQVAVPF